MGQKIKKLNIIFPIYNDFTNAADKEIIQIFIQRYRDLNLSREDVKVTQAIHKTADLTGYSDGVITKILVDYGLRVNRRSLPQQFLDHIDTLGLRYKSRPSYEKLKEFWVQEGEDVFAFVKPIQAQSYSLTYM